MPTKGDQRCKTEKPKRTDYMQGFIDGMNRAAEYGQQVEGDCGGVEHL